MSVSSIFPGAFRHCVRTAYRVLLDLGRLVVLTVKPRIAVAAENLFLRKQLAMCQERKIKPHRADDSTRWLMAALSRLFDWRMHWWS
jgi:putative transposase